MAPKTLPCDCCGFPVFRTVMWKGKEIVAGADGKPVICSHCEMIANGRLYKDGSDPADRMAPAMIEKIKSRYAELTVTA